MTRQSDVAHREREKRSAGKDQRDHAIQARRAEQAGVKGLASERALYSRDQQCSDGTERRGCGMRENTGADRYQPEPAVQNDGADVALRAEHLRNSAARFESRL